MGGQEIDDERGDEDLRVSFARVAVVVAIKLDMSQQPITAGA